MFWLFKHPDVAKYQSQKSLHWMARRLNTFVGNVKSRWAKIHSLHEMGFEQFLDPEVEWSNDSPEVLELVKQGKKHSNALGVYPGQQSNIRYLGSLLKMLGMKLKCTRKEGKDKRFYQLDQEGLTTPTRLQVLACIENRFAQPEEKLDWESAINEAHGIMPENDPLTQSGQAFQPTARTPEILYRNEVPPASRNLGLESQGDREVLEAAAGQKSELEQLVEALPFAQSLEDFASIVEGNPLEAVGDAIALQPNQPRRIQLQAWLDALNQPVREVEPQPLKPRSWEWSELPAVKSVLRWIDRTEQVRLLTIDASGLCQVRSLLSGLVVNTHASQLIPVSG
jgi:hypothetical protein